MREYISVEKAAELLSDAALPVGSEELPLIEAAHRVSFDDVKALIDLPPFDRSVMDGYAIRAADAGCAHERPVTFPVVREIFAGQGSEEHFKPLRHGEAARVATGAGVPEGADCVVRQEDVKEEAGFITLSNAPFAHQNYAFAGEDARRGDILASKGETLSSARLGLIAGQGLSAIRVFSRPTVGVLSTGSELAREDETARPLPRGKIHDINSVILATRLSSLGMNASLAPPLPDEASILTEKIKSMAQVCDMVITTGGVSVGQKDYMPLVAQKLAARTLFHGVAVKPGGVALGMVVGEKNTVVLCLSGAPLAAVATFEVLARPVLAKLSGNATVYPKRVSVEAGNSFDKAGSTRRLIWARRDAGFVFFPGRTFGRLLTMAECDCLIDADSCSLPIKQGAQVRAIMTR
ncbi:molybdopterin molybdenumtransferase MoeA [Synergistales bacterium]|nr:molybdopterin molybdenumtransferase MoeA [Synergistales bacterium]